MKTLEEYLFKAQLLNEMFKNEEDFLKRDIDYVTKRLESLMAEDSDNEYAKEMYTKDITDAVKKLNVLKTLEQDIINNLIR